MKKGLKIIVPVAGEGTRMRPHTYTVPKPLLPVAGKPVLSHVIDPLTFLEPEEMIFVIGHLGDQIEEFVKKQYKFPVSFVRQQELLGLGFAIYLALKVVKPGPLLVVLGDTIAKTDYKEFVKSDRNVIGLKAVKDPRRFGVAVIDNGRIIALEEKPQNPKSDLALIGLYYFPDSEVLKLHLGKLVEMGKKTSGEIQLTDALEFMLGAGELFKPFIIDGWYDCGKRETILETNRLLLEELNAFNDYPGSIIVPPVHISPSARIEQSIIGPYVTVADGAQVHKSIIRDSIIGRKSVIEHSLLEQSLVGEKAVVRGSFDRLNIGSSTEIG